MTTLSASDKCRKGIKLPRPSIGILMCVVGIVALNLAVGRTIYQFVPWRLAGVFLIGLLLQAGLLCLFRGRSRRRLYAFWVGFELGAVLGLTSFLYARVPDSWIGSLWEKYAEFIDVLLRTHFGLPVLNRGAKDQLSSRTASVWHVHCRMDKQADRQPVVRPDCPRATLAFLTGRRSAGAQRRTAGRSSSAVAPTRRPRPGGGSIRRSIGTAARRRSTRPAAGEAGAARSCSRIAAIERTGFAPEPPSKCAANRFRSVAQTTFPPVGKTGEDHQPRQQQKTKEAEPPRVTLPPHVVGTSPDEQGPASQPDR
jgi:hypothetical protein